jgi:hypothetical protein
VWAFDHPVVTEEDRQRNTYYSHAQQFGKAVRGAADLKHFYETLQLRVTVQPLGFDRLNRAAQLTQRTNQFNTTTVRRTEADIATLMQSGRPVLMVEAADRFGDYGVIGLVIAEERGQEFYVDNFLLSCRALGRGVEHRVMRELGRLAAERGLETVVVPLIVTAKNQPAQQFLESTGAHWRVGSEYWFPVRALGSLEFTPAITALRTEAEKPKAKGKARRRMIDYNRIAHELSTSGQILSAIRRRRMTSGESVPAADPPSTDAEMRLAAIWSDLLERATIGRGDNFFDLGGHSLLAVLMLVRIKEAFGIDLHIDDVYSASMTLAGMAATIEAHQMGAVDAADYAALLAEIEGLSDEEVRALLEQEETGQIGD